MKVFIYSGSNRPKVSLSNRLAELFKIYLKEKQIDCDVFTPFNSHLEYCKGCASCFMTGRCPINDDINRIKQSMFDSDVIIFISPVYAHQVTAPMKNFIDRVCYMSHFMPFAGKAAIPISVSDTNGNKYVTDYLEKQMHYLGLTLIDRIDILGGLIEEEVAESYVKNAVGLISHYERRYDLTINPEQEEIFDFYQKTYAEGRNPDQQRWYNQGYQNFKSFADLVESKRPQNCKSPN